MRCIARGERIALKVLSTKGTRLEVEEVKMK
jgi:hypothetical protein